MAGVAGVVFTCVAECQGLISPYMDKDCPGSRLRSSSLAGGAGEKVEQQGCTEYVQVYEGLGGPGLAHQYSVSHRDRIGYKINLHYEGISTLRSDQHRTGYG